MDKNKAYYKSLGINTEAARFKKYKEAGLLERVDEDFVKEAKQYWQKHYHIKIDPILHIAFMNLTGKKDPRVAFNTTIRSQFVPFFNDQRMRDAYTDKNIYDMLIPTERSVVTVLKRVHGLYFDMENNYLEKSNIVDKMISFGESLIVKPSATNNGIKIRKLNYKEGGLFLDDQKVTVKALEDLYGGDFAVQKIVKQHHTMAKPHPSSVNTLRMVTFRWKNEINYLLTFARFGSDHGVQDNAGTGGLCLGVTEEGYFLDEAIDEYCNVYIEHPTTGFPFKEMVSIPNFEEFKKFVKDLHKNILHHDFISWDIVVGKDGLPVFLEANFSGATWLYQLASQQSLFGDLTEEVLAHVYKERNDKKSPRRKSLSYNKNKRPKKTRDQKSQNINKAGISKSSEQLILEKQIKLLQDENLQVRRERDKYKRESREIIQSSSWRVTLPFRKISSLLKRK